MSAIVHRERWLLCPSRADRQRPRSPQFEAQQSPAEGCGRPSTGAVYRKSEARCIVILGAFYRHSL